MAEAVTKQPTADKDDADDLATWRARVTGTNINNVTLLATDYLNHFNEVVMMIEMIPDMPECLGDVRDWAPKGYQAHFADSVFSDKELAIAAYEHAPTDFRNRLEEMIGQADRLVEHSIARIETVLEHADDDALRVVTGRASRDLQRLIEVAGAIINGAMPTISQADIDAMFAH